MRDVLYGALSRRRRRSLHRKYAELIEKRSAGRLERVYPELVHHFWQGDVPEKTVDYGLKLAQKSLDTFSPEDAIRVAKITLEFLEDEEWEGDPALEGDARLMLAQGQRMTGNIEGALREAEAAVRVFEEQKRAGRAVGAILFAAETAWQARRIDDARRWVERGIEAARASGEPEHLARLLSLGATVANLRGEYAKATAYQSEIVALTPREKAPEEEIPRGGTLVVALSEPGRGHGACRSTRPPRSTRSWPTCSRPSSRRTPRAISRPHLCGSLGSRGRGLSRAPPPAARRRLLGRAAADRRRPSRRRSSARFVSPAGRHAGGLRRDRGDPGLPEGRRRVRRGNRGASPSEEVRSPASPTRVPIFPSLLTDGRTAIADRAVGRRRRRRPVGTGPFRTVAPHSEPGDPRAQSATLAVPGARLDRIEFRASLLGLGDRRRPAVRARSTWPGISCPGISNAILREPRFRGGLVETPKKNTYFVVFHAGSPAGIECGPADGARRSGAQRRTSSGARSAGSRCRRPA